MRIQTSCSQPREGNPSWVESFVRSSQCLFIFASRGEVQCRLPILRSYPLVPRQWYARIVFIFMLYGSSFFFLFDTCTEPLNRSQTWRPDPFRLSAVTTRGLCLYSSRDLLFSFLWHTWHSKSKECKTTISKLESICFLTEQHQKIMALAELNGDWSFQSLTWEGPQEVTVYVISVKNQLSLIHTGCKVLKMSSFSVSGISMPSTSCKCQNPYIARLQEDVSGYRHSTLSRTNSLSLYCHFLFETLSTYILVVRF